jgi:hypothetical protein
MPIAHLWQSESFSQHCNDASEKAMVFFVSVGKSGSRETQLTVKRKFFVQLSTLGYDDFDLFWEMKEAKLCS